MNKFEYNTSNSCFYNYAHNFVSFGYGYAKGTINQIKPTIYAFGLAQGGNAMGLSGLTANCLSVGLGTIDAAKGLFHFINNVRSFNFHDTSLPSQALRCFEVAQNIHQIVVGIAMVNNIFAPSPLTNAIVSAELLRHGLVNTLKGCSQMQKSLNFNNDFKRRDWAGIGEATVTILFGLNYGAEGALKLLEPNTLERSKIEVHKKKSGNEISNGLKKEYAVELIASWDHNGALDPTNVPQRASKNLRDIYTVYSSKVKNEQEICSVLRETKEKIGKPFDVALIKAHGNERGIILSPGQVITTVNVETIAGCLKETLNKKAPIFLSSCKTGNPRPGNRLNFAERLASETDHPIYASVLSSISDECEVIDINYLGDTPKFAYSCALSLERNQLWEESVPQISNPATLKTNEYNRLIERSKDARDVSSAQEDRLYNLFVSKVSTLVPLDVWSMLAKTQLWQTLNKWWEQ